MCFLLGGLCSSWGQVFQAIAELWAPEAKGYWFFLCSDIFSTSMHAGVQLEGLKMKRTGLWDVGRMEHFTMAIMFPVFWYNRESFAFPMLFSSLNDKK